MHPHSTQAFLRAILPFKMGHFTMVTSYALLFSQKRAHEPTLGFVLHSKIKYSSFLGHCLGLVYAFFALLAFGIWPNCYFFAHNPTHLLGSSWAFLLIGLLDMNYKKMGINNNWDSHLAKLQLLL